MPITLNKAIEHRNTITITIDGDTLNFKYKPSLYNQTILADLRRETTAPKPEGEMTPDERAEWEMQQAMANVRFLLKLDPTWDLLDKPAKEGGQPLPVTEDLLVQLGLEIQQFLAASIIEKINSAGTKPKV